MHYEEFMKRLNEESMEHFNGELGERLKEFRKKAKARTAKRKLTKQELAKKLEVCQSTINNYENGVSSVSAYILKKYCEIYSVSITELYGIEGGDAEILQALDNLSPKDREIIISLIERLKTPRNLANKV